MKKYFVVDNRISTRSAIFNEMNFDTQEEAEKEAEKQLSYMTEKEKKECDGFYIELCEVDEEGISDYMTEGKIIKTYI